MIILVKSDILNLFKISEATLHRWLNDSRNGTGTFPLPISPPHKTLRWNSDDVEHWCKAKGTLHQKQPARKVDTMLAGYKQARLQSAATRHGLVLK